MNTINYTSIEQSDTLLKLGLNPESADLCYHCYYVGDENGDHPYYKLGEREEKCREKDCIPCWSVRALLAIIAEVNIAVGWSNLEGIDKPLFGIRTGEETAEYFESPYEVVVWLLENGHIKKSK